MVDELNHMWVGDYFAGPFLTLVKQIGNEATQSDVLVIHCMWILVLIGDSSIPDVFPDLVITIILPTRGGEDLSILLIGFRLPPFWTKANWIYVGFNGKEVL